MNCRNCEDSGYTFDTLHACHECDLGKPIQHEKDKDELERHLKIANTLRIKILTYESMQAYGKVSMTPVKLKGLERA